MVFLNIMFGTGKCEIRFAQNIHPVVVVGRCSNELLVALIELLHTAACSLGTRQWSSLKWMHEMGFFKMSGKNRERIKHL
jgi:hypothetical protein